MKPSFLLLCCATYLACSAPPAKAPPHVALTVRAALEPLHEKLPPPKAGDWLAAHAEPGQSFVQYVASCPLRAIGSRRTLYVAEVGRFPTDQRQVVGEVRLFLAAHFGLPVREATPVAMDEGAMPDGTWRTGPLGTRQWLTTYLMDERLKARVPPDAAALLGFTVVDLWPGMGWNFVFGQASLRDRIGVYSLARLCPLHPEEGTDRVCLLRALKLASHEAGHMFGFLHCTAFRCGMNGSNSLDELDRNPLELCPECLAKLTYATGVDKLERFKTLEAFARKRGLDAEADLYRRSATALEALSPTR